MPEIVFLLCEIPFLTVAQFSPILQLPPILDVLMFYLRTDLMRHRYITYTYKINTKCSFLKNVEIYTLDSRRGFSLFLIFHRVKQTESKTT